MGTNFTEFASTCAARAVSSLERLALGFERQTGIHPEATAHSRRSDAKDVQIVVEVVPKARIQCHSKFPNFSSNPLHRFDRDRMIIWIKKKAKQHSKISDTQSNNSADSDDEDEEDRAMRSTRWTTNGHIYISTICAQHTLYITAFICTNVFQTPR